MNQMEKPRLMYVNLLFLPLVTIQQYALRKIQQLQKQKTVDKEQIEVFEKIVTRVRCMASSMRVETLPKKTKTLKLNFRVFSFLTSIK